MGIVHPFSFGIPELKPEGLVAVDHGFDGGSCPDDFGAGQQVGFGDFTGFGGGSAHPYPSAGVDKIAHQLAQRVERHPPGTHPYSLWWPR